MMHIILYLGLKMLARIAKAIGLIMLYALPASANDQIFLCKPYYDYLSAIGATYEFSGGEIIVRQSPEGEVSVRSKAWVTPYFGEASILQNTPGFQLQVQGATFRMEDDVLYGALIDTIPFTAARSFVAKCDRI